MNASQPASNAPFEWPASAWPVSAMTGMSRVRGSSLRRRVASQPSRPGSDRSITITSGSSENALSSASWPFSASSTRSPEYVRNCTYMSRLSG